MGNLAHALNVVLAASEVPHEVTPVHVVQLVVHKEAQVLHHGGLGLHLLAVGIAIDVQRGGCLDLGTLHTDPIDILTLALFVMDAREDHVLFGTVFVSLLGTKFLIAVGIIGVFLHLGGILHGALLGGGLHHAITLVLVHDVAVEGAAINQRGLTILLTAQVLGQGVSVVGRILIKRGVL